MSDILWMKHLISSPTDATMPCGKYILYVLKLPSRYTITSVSVGVGVTTFGFTIAGLEVEVWVGVRPSVTHCPCACTCPPVSVCPMTEQRNSVLGSLTARSCTCSWSQYWALARVTCTIEDKTQKTRQKTAQHEMARQKTAQYKTAWQNTQWYETTRQKTAQYLTTQYETEIIKLSYWVCVECWDGYARLFTMNQICFQKVHQ